MEPYVQHGMGKGCDWDTIVKNQIKKQTKPIHQMRQNLLIRNIMNLNYIGPNYRSFRIYHGFIKSSFFKSTLYQEYPYITNILAINVKRINFKAFRHTVLNIAIDHAWTVRRLNNYQVYLVRKHHPSAMSAVIISEAEDRVYQHMTVTRRCDAAARARPGACARRHTASSEHLLYVVEYFTSLLCELI